MQESAGSTPAGITLKTWSVSVLVAHRRGKAEGRVQLPGGPLTIWACMPMVATDPCKIGVIGSTPIRSTRQRADRPTGRHRPGVAEIRVRFPVGPLRNLGNHDMTRHDQPLTLRLPFAMVDRHLRMEQILAADPSRSWAKSFPMLPVFAMTRPETGFARRLLRMKRNVWLFRCNASVTAIALGRRGRVEAQSRVEIRRCRGRQPVAESRGGGHGTGGVGGHNRQRFAGQIGLRWW